MIFFGCINTFSLSLLTVTATSKVFISQFSLTVCVCEFEYLHEYLNMCAVCVPDRHIAVPYHTRTRTRNSCSSCLTFSQVGLATATCNMLISPSLAVFPLFPLYRTVFVFGVRVASTSIKRCGISRLVVLL